MSLKQYTCNILGHGGKEIIGMCQNANCSQQSRRVCFLCQQIHWKQDPQFDPADIKDEAQLEEIIDESKRKLTSTVRETKLLCDIQDYLLQLEMIQFIIMITDELEKFRTESLNSISIKNYIGDNNLIGINQYIRTIESKLVDVNQIKNSYLINSASKQINLEKINQVDQKAFQRDLQDTLSYRNKQKENSLEQIFQSHQFQYVQLSDNYVTLCETLLKQGKKINKIAYDLKIANLYEQYQQLCQTVLPSHIEEYQLFYLDAYALYYSQNKDKTINQQLALIQKSLEVNQDYPKSKELKEIIQGLINDQVSNQMADSYVQKANNFIQSNQFQEAITILDQAIQVKPDFQQAYLIQGICYQKLQNHEEAVHILNQAITLNPKDDKSLERKAFSLLRLERYIDSLETIQKLNKLTELRNLHNERYQDAMVEYDKAILIDPSETTSYNNKGFLLVQLERYQEAIEMFDLAIQQDPQTYTFFQNKGQAQYPLQRYQESLDSFDQAIILKPLEEILYKLKARSLVQLGRDQGATDLLKNFYTDNPNLKREQQD